MSLKSGKEIIDFYKTVQKHLHDGLDPTISTLPQGMSEADRSLVNQIAELMYQFEQDSFADPSGNTERNRRTRFLKEMSTLSHESVERLAKNEEVQKAIKDKVAEKIAALRMDKVISENKSLEDYTFVDPTAAAFDQISDLTSAAKDEIHRRDSLFSKILTEIGAHIETSNQTIKKDLDKQKKKEEDGKKKQGNKSSILDDMVSQVTNNQQNVSTWARGLLASSNPDAYMQNYQKTVHAARATTMMNIANSVKKSEAKVASAKLAMEAAGKMGSGGARWGKNIATIGKFALGGVVGTIALGAKLISGTVKTVGKLAVGIVKGVWNIGKGIYSLTKKTINFLLVKPLKWVGNLLKRPGFWALFFAALMTNTGMKMLGFVYGKLKLAISGGFSGIIDLIKKIFGGVAALLSGAWSAVLDFIKGNKFIQTVLKFAKSWWANWLKEHPNVAKFIDATGNFLETVKSGVLTVYDFIKKQVESASQFWSDTMAEYDKEYDRYVEQSKAEGKTNIRSKALFVADNIHKNITDALTPIVEDVEGIVSCVVPLYEFASNIVGAIASSKYVMPMIGILYNAWTYRNSSPTASYIINALSLVYGPLGTLLGGAIAWMTEKAVLAIFNLMKRDEAKLETSEKILDRYGGAKKIESNSAKTKKFLEDVDSGILANLKVLDSRGNEIGSADEKRKRIIGLYERFQKSMKEEIERNDSISRSLNEVRLVSEGGNSLNNAGNLYEMFSNSGVLDKGLLAVKYFGVTEFLGLRSKEVLDAMAKQKDVTTINRIGLNLIRTKVRMVSEIYGNILNIVDKMENSPGANNEAMLGLLYSYLSPDGQMYQKVKKQLSQNMSAKFFDKLAEGWDFNEKAEGKMLDEIKSLGTDGFDSITAIDKAITEQIKLHTRGKLTENAVMAGRRVATHTKAIANAYGEHLTTVGENLTSGTFTGVATGALQSTKLGLAAAAVGSGLTTAIMTDSTYDRYSKIGGTGSGKFDLGDTSEVFTSGNAASIVMSDSGDKRRRRRMSKTLDELMSGKTVTNPEMLQKIYEGFFNDLYRIGASGHSTANGNTNTANASIAGGAIRIMKRLEAMKQRGDNIGLEAFEKIYADDGRQATESQKRMAEAAYELYSLNAGQDFEKMQQWMEKVGMGIGELSQNRELLFSEKYRGKEIHEIVEDFINEQMANSDLTEAQKKYLETYFKEGFKDKSSGLKTAIASKITLNQTMMEAIRKLEEKQKNKKGGGK